MLIAVKASIPVPMLCKKKPELTPSFVHQVVEEVQQVSIVTGLF
jgi:hypothetical protein